MGTFEPHLEILPQAQREIWPRLKEIPHWFTLYGGTALALRLGHRASVDFDFFSSESFTEAELRDKISFVRAAQIAQRGENPLVLMLPDFNNVRMSFFGGLTLGRISDPDFDNQEQVLVASVDDLAATKLAVITKRAASRDYLDVAALLRSGLNLARALGCAKAVYRQEFDPILGLKALGYFGDLPELPKETKEFLAAAAGSVDKIPEVQAVGRLTPDCFSKSTV